MPELFLLLAFMAATLVVLAGLMFIFKGWMARKDQLIGQGPGTMSRGHGHH